MSTTFLSQTTELDCPRPDLKRHDTAAAYHGGCRCAAAREAHRLYYKRRREGRAVPIRVPVTPTARRLQALAAIGWDCSSIGQRLGTNRQRVAAMMRADRAYMFRDTAEKVDAVYRELCMTPGPSRVVRRIAKSRGWAPPLAWDDDEIDNPKARPKGAVVAHSIDELAVQLAVKGQLGTRKLTRREAHVAIQRMRELGIPTGEIARRANVSDRTVHRQGHEHTTTAAA